MDKTTNKTPLQIGFYEGGKRNNAVVRLAVYDDDYYEAYALGYSGLRSKTEALKKRLNKGDTVTLEGASNFPDFKDYYSGDEYLPYQIFRLKVNDKKKDFILRESERGDIQDHLFVLSNNDLNLEKYKERAVESIVASLASVDDDESGRLLNEISFTPSNQKFELIQSRSQEIINSIGYYDYLNSTSKDRDEQNFFISWDGEVEKDLYHTLYTNYSVPILEEWMEYIYKSLDEYGLLKELKVYNENNSKTRAFFLNVTDGSLKHIVSKGIKSMDIVFASYGEDEEIEDKYSDITTVSDYLQTFAGELGVLIQDRFELGFNPLEDAHHPAFYDLNMTANKNGITGYYPPQANTIMGVANALQKSNFNFLIGEMGIIAHLKCG